MLRGDSPSVLTFGRSPRRRPSQGRASLRRRASRPAASPSVQKRRAIASLTMTKGRVSGRSAALKLRPRTISMPAASKNPGLTSVRSAMKAPWSAGGSKPVDVEVDRALAERVQVQVADGADRLDAGERPEAIQEAPRVDARRVGREPGRRRQEGHQGGGLAAEARVDRLHPLKAAQEQAGTDEQHQRDRQLRDDERVAPPELTGLAAPACSLLRAPAMSGRVRCSAGTRPSRAQGTTEARRRHAHLLRRYVRP